MQNHGETCAGPGPDGAWSRPPAAGPNYRLHSLSVHRSGTGVGKDLRVFPSLPGAVAALGGLPVDKVADSSLPWFTRPSPCGRRQHRRWGRRAGPQRGLQPPALLLIRMWKTDPGDPVLGSGAEGNALRTCAEMGRRSGRRVRGTPLPAAKHNKGIKRLQRGGYRVTRHRLARRRKIAAGAGAVVEQGFGRLALEFSGSPRRSFRAPRPLSEV